MNRSDFYYDQEVREAELDQVFDDVEDMEQNKIIDFDLWGVISGLEASQQSSPDLTVQVSVGIGHCQNGKRVIASSIENIDLSSHLPTTGAGYFRYVDIYAVDYMDESDPRLDGHSNPINYRLTEGIDFLIVEGTESTGTPPSPIENIDNLPLNRVLLEFGQTQILDSDISSGHRKDGKIAWIVSRNTQNHLVFDYSPGSHEYQINNAISMTLGLYTSIGEKGFDANGRSVEDAGFMSMRSGGLGFDMNDNELTEVEKITLGTGVAGVGLDMSQLSIDDVEDIHFDVGANGYIDGSVTNLVFSVASGGGIDLNGRDIFCSSGLWQGTDCDRIDFDDGLGSGIALQLTDSVIDRCAVFYNEPGTGTGIDTSGKNIITDGGDLDLSTSGTDGDITCNAISMTGSLSGIGYINLDGAISTALNVYSDGHVYADYDGNGVGDFSYGPIGGEKTQFLTLGADDAYSQGTVWSFLSGGRDNGSNKRPQWAASGLSLYDLCVFPVHLPKGARVISVKSKVYGVTASDVEMTFVRYNLQIDTSTTGPSDRTTAPNATPTANTGTANFETLTDTLSSPHTISEDYIYEVVFEALAADCLVYGVEIEYEISTVVAGLH